MAEAYQDKRTSTFIKYLERSYPVERWKVGDIYVWPYIRIKLYLFLLSKSINTGSSFKVKVNHSAEKKGLGLKDSIGAVVQASIRYPLFLLSLKKKSIIFFGSHIHRVAHPKGYFNRFFDSMVDYHSIQDKVYLVEHQKVYDGSFNQKSIIPLEKILSYYKVLRKFKEREIGSVNLPHYKLFLEDIKKMDPGSSYLSFEIVDLQNWVAKIHELSFFFKSFYKRVKPEKVIFPGYYGWDNLYAAVYTANKLKIKTVDFQHGPQVNHMVFSDWGKHPERGFDLMPKEYWNWDGMSRDNILKWSTYLKDIKAKISGQPYLEYTRSKMVQQNSSNILFTLQTFPLETMLPTTLLRVIRDLEYKWIFRLHPRNSFKTEEIASYLEKNGVSRQKFLFHHSKEVPIAISISDSFIHVTGFSGCVLEARLMGIPSIVINEIGKEMFEEYIDSQSVFYLSKNDNEFEEGFSTILNQVFGLKLNTNRGGIVNPIHF